MRYVTESIADALYQRRVNENTVTESADDLEKTLMSKFKDLSDKDIKTLKNAKVDEGSYKYGGKTYKYAQEVADSKDSDEFIEDGDLKDYVEVVDTKGAYGEKGQMYVLYNESVCEAFKVEDTTLKNRYTEAIKLSDMIQYRDTYNNEWRYVKTDVDKVWKAFVELFNKNKKVNYSELDELCGKLKVKLVDGKGKSLDYLFESVKPKKKPDQLRDEMSLRKKAEEKWTDADTKKWEDFCSDADSYSVNANDIGADVHKGKTYYRVRKLSNKAYIVSTFGTSFSTDNSKAKKREIWEF